MTTDYLPAKVSMKIMEILREADFSFDDASRRLNSIKVTNFVSTETLRTRILRGKFEKNWGIELARFAGLRNSDAAQRIREILTN